MPVGCIRLGVTGGIGSGKSTFSTMLQRHGAVLIDADAIARATTQPGGSAMPAIRQIFGADFIGRDGALNRDRMRTLAFTDAGARTRLQEIIHPLVRAAIAQAEAAACAAGERLVVLDIPLLTESAHWPARLDTVVVVDCLEATQERRVQQRNGLPTEAVRNIIATQSSRAKRRSMADIVVFNEDIGLAELNRHAQEIAVWFGL
jgi:dephospho-CoA kinase